MPKCCSSCYGCWLVLSNLFKLGVYIADVVTDIILAAEYYRNGEKHWFGFTLGFTLGPQFIMNMTLWYLEGRNWRTFILYFLHIGVALKYLEVVVGVGCSCYDPEKIRKDQDKTQDEQEPVSRTVHHFFPLVHLIGSLLESVPQMCLQGHIAIVTGELERNEINTLKYVTVSMSLVTAVKALLDWEMHYLTFKATLVYGIPFAIWKAVELFSRIVTICVFSSLYTYWVFVMVGVHWLLMAITENVMCSYFRKANSWVDPDDDIYSKSSKRIQFCFNVFTVSPVDVFAWATFGSRSLSKVQPIVNGVLTLLGNYVTVLIWYFLRDVSTWYDSCALISVLAGTATSLLVLKPLYLWCYTDGPCHVVRWE